MTLLPLHQGTNFLHIDPTVPDSVSLMSARSSQYNEYGEPTGNKELRDLIAAHFNIDQSKHRICLTNGSIEAIYMILQRCAVLGTFVDCIPSWPWPRIFAKQFGYNIVTTIGKITPQIIRENRLSIINLVNGQNPMGYAYTDQELAEIGATAKMCSCVILHDMAHYDLFDKPYDSLLGVNPEANYMTFSFSKGNGLAAMRIGGFACSKDNMAYYDQISPARLGVNTLGEIAAKASMHSIKQWKPSMLDIISENKFIVHSSRKVNRLGIEFGEDSVHRISMALPSWMPSFRFADEMKKRGVQVCDIASRMGETIGERDERFNMIGATMAIKDYWLHKFIDAFGESYDTLAK